MFKTFAIALALTLAAGAASANKIDANGRCHDDAGKFAKAEVCGGVSTTKTTSKTTTTKSTTTTAPPMASAAPAKAEKCRDDKGHFVKCGAAPAVAADANGPYKLDAKGKCHDAKGKMAKKEMCAAK